MHVIAGTYFENFLYLEQSFFYGNKFSLIEKVNKMNFMIRKLNEQMMVIQTIHWLIECQW